MKLYVLLNRLIDTSFRSHPQSKQSQSSMFSSAVIRSQKKVIAIQMFLHGYGIRNAFNCSHQWPVANSSLSVSLRKRQPCRHQLLSFRRPGRVAKNSARFAKASLAFGAATVNQSPLGWPNVTSGHAFIHRGHTAWTTSLPIHWGCLGRSSGRAPHSHCVNNTLSRIHVNWSSSNPRCAQNLPADCKHTRTSAQCRKKSSFGTWPSIPSLTSFRASGAKAKAPFMLCST